MNLSVDEVALRLKKQPQDVIAWESGEEVPTYVQLERLAYQLYKRPVALFFFPEVPAEDGARGAFRTLPEFEFERLSSRILSLVREAQAKQFKLAELLQGDSIAEHSILEECQVDLRTPVDSIAASLRSYLGVTIDAQIEWQDNAVAFEKWRETIGDHGVFVFKQAFRQDEISGFCLYHVTYPVIYVNNTMAYSRQVFTVIHELGHLLFKTSGIDKVRDDYVTALRGEDAEIERFCNRFAAQVLVPESDFDLASRNVAPNEEGISQLAQRYSVSREVVLRRFKDRGQVDQETYDVLADKWRDEALRGGGGPGGGNYYATQRAYLGRRYLDLVFQQYYRNKIDLYQLAEYLNMKVDSVRRLEYAMKQ